MSVLQRLENLWADCSDSFLVRGTEKLHVSDLWKTTPDHLKTVRAGDVVALVGDFDPISISNLLRLFDRGAIVVPLSPDTRGDHEYFFENALVDCVVEGADFTTRQAPRPRHPLLEKLRSSKRGGLVLFSTGTTGRPKAILHDLSVFLRKFETPRPALRTLSFLLFDHIGGLNTLLHTLFNKGAVISPQSRTVDSILTACQEHKVELLPTTPTFLRMMLLSGAIPDRIPDSIRVITYGTERMDQHTLTELCVALPKVDFRQTYGMSELGIVRAKSRARDSLFMKIGGEGIETRIRSGILEIRSASRMMGYLNADSPFDAEGWYDTKDLVEVDGEFLKVTGRLSEIFNVGGLKFSAEEVEQVALRFPGVKLVKALAKMNPITGQHVELKVEPVHEGSINKTELTDFLKAALAPHMVPKRLHFEVIPVGHRFKRI
jgi:long-chain acyl-CoA synthetase